MVSTIPQYKPTFNFKEDNEEGHPDPREVLFLIDTQQMTLNEIKMILTEALNQIDAQIYFNFIILGLGVPYKIFNKSEQATNKTLIKAREYLTSELFEQKFNESKETKNNLIQSLKPV
jgi:hypothetical protein